MQLAVRCGCANHDIGVGSATRVRVQNMACMSGSTKTSAPRTVERI